MYIALYFSGSHGKSLYLNPLYTVVSQVPVEHPTLSSTVSRHIPRYTTGFTLVIHDIPQIPALSHGIPWDKPRENMKTKYTPSRGKSP